MLFGYFILSVALLISGIAAYYSIVGLAALFAAAVIPVIIMGAALEAGKITAAVWLKVNWQRASITYKLYLVPAVVVLMLLTSMGIFGFLSKAHLDQTANTQESQAQIERLNTEINRRTDIVKRAEQKIKELESTGTGQDAQIQSQIDREQNRIDAALKRIEPAIKEQNDIIGSQNKLYQDQLTKIDNDLERLQNNLNKNEIAAAQSQVGVQPDGRIGPRTQAAFKEYRDRLSLEKQELINQLERSNSNPNIQAARREIQRIRSTVETQIAESNQLINRLRSQVGKGNSTNIDGLIDEQQIRIKTANQELEQFIEQKYKLETEFRKLEAEVGPVKYLAELIYGSNPDKSLLENAVRIVIIIIVTVFDPLALVLILAAQQSLRWAKQNPKSITKTQDKDQTEKQFDITQHPYLSTPWVSVPGGEPLVATDAAKEKVNCDICTSELINANELGMVCSNLKCTSYTLSNIEEETIVIKTNSSIITADSSISAIGESNKETLKQETTELHKEKTIEAKRAYKAPLITVPETRNVRKISDQQRNNLNNTQED